MAYTEKDKSNHIKEIQTYLRGIAASEGNLPLIIPDGIYGEQTRKAVEMFQLEHGLAVTGEVDNTTWDEIVDEYTKLRASIDTPSCILPFPDASKVLNKGDSGYDVYFLQIMVCAISEFAENIPRAPITGFYDSETEIAIKKYQSLADLDQTGATDVLTWNMLARSFNSFYARK